MSAAGEVFQYAVLQVVPSLPRGERMNVGVVLFSRRLRYLAAGVRVDEERLRALDPGLDVESVRSHLEGLERIARGDREGGPLAELDQSERFHWLTATSSTIVQASPVHTGLCSDGEAMLARLMAELVDPPAA